MNSVLRSSYKTIVTAGFYSFLKLFKLSKIVSSRASYFSISHTITPVLAAHITFKELTAVAALRTLIHGILYPAAGIFGLFYYLPSLTGAYFFKILLESHHTLTRVVCALMPLACMALFISTPVGSSAWVYSLYWLIPSVIALRARPPVFLVALASTFMTHAVGSVLFIFCTPMTPAFWLALLPVVALERCMFAAGITALYYLITLAKIAYKTLLARIALA